MLKNNKKIAVLTTGGTIAGVGEIGQDEGYKSGSINIAEIYNDSHCLAFIEICNVNSDDITSQHWLLLYNKLKELSNEYDGFIITHGTDTLEETALFLSLTLKLDKPVVLTGAMRPSTSSNPDGPANLKNAIITINQKNDGVWVVFGDRVLTGSECYKYRTNSLNAFDSDGFNPNYTLDIDSVRELPSVGIIYFNTDADAKMLQFAIDNYDGVVIAGAGVGEFSIDFVNTVNDSSKPIIASSRINNTEVKKINLLTKKAIPAYRLNPQKAATLLRIALSLKYDNDGLTKLYNA